MSKPLVQGSIRTLVHFPGGYARDQQDQFTNFGGELDGYSAHLERPQP